MPLMITDWCTKKPVAHIWNFIFLYTQSHAPFFSVVMCISFWHIHITQTTRITRISSCYDALSVESNKSHLNTLAFHRSIFLSLFTLLMCVSECVWHTHTVDGDVDDLAIAYAHAYPLNPEQITIKLTTKPIVQWSKWEIRNLNLQHQLVKNQSHFIRSLFFLWTQIYRWGGKEFKFDECKCVRIHKLRNQFCWVRVGRRSSTYWPFLDLFEKNLTKTYAILRLSPRYAYWYTIKTI